MAVAPYGMESAVLLAHAASADSDLLEDPPPRTRCGLDTAP